jgi:hypothetical protein
MGYLKYSNGYTQVLLQLLFIADVARRRVHLPEHDRSKPGRQVVTFLLICNVTMWVIYTFEAQKVIANPVQVCGCSGNSALSRMATTQSEIYPVKISSGCWYYPIT